MNIKTTIVLLIVVAFPVFASQVFYMSTEEALELTECIFLAEAGMILDIPMSYTDRTQYTFHILEVVIGTDSLEGTYLSYYSANLPWAYTGQNGEEISRSPLLTGSGYETIVEEGDTVIVFSDLPVDDSHPLNLIRIEHVDSLESIQEILEAESFRSSAE